MLLRSPCYGLHDSRLITRPEIGVHRQAEDLPAQTVRNWRAAWRRREMAIPVLAGQRNRVVDCGRNARPTASGGHGVAIDRPAVFQPDGVLRPDGGGAGRYWRYRDGVGKPSV